MLTHLNKSLLPLLEEDDNFKDVAPSLFGPEFARKSKELIDQVKAIRSTAQKFRQGPPRAGGLQSTTRERWRPELRERQSPVSAEPESSGNQTIDLPMYTDHLIINYKGTLACQIACMGVKNLGLTDLPQAGKLCHHLSNWSIITQDRWVLNTVQGYLIDFVSEPHQQSPPNPPHCSSEQTSLIQELTKLLKKQAIRQLEHPAEAGFLSNIFLVPKKDGGQRPVINLKALNRLVNTEHFKMEGIHTVKDLLKPGY